MAAKIRSGLGVAEQDLAARRQIIVELDVWATLVVEQGQKVVYTRCRFGDREFSLVPKSARVLQPNRKDGIALAARIVLPKRSQRKRR